MVSTQESQRRESFLNPNKANQRDLVTLHSLNVRGREHLRTFDNFDVTTVKSREGKEQLGLACG